MSARVLIVDDHAPFRALARRVLTADGFDIVGDATDGASALDAARALRPDVVLLDVQLPDVDGFRVAREAPATSRRARRSCSSPPGRAATTAAG